MTQAIKTFEDVLVWQKAHAFVLLVYRATKRFPADEKYGLTSQLRRSAVSIPANFAEGFGKRTKADKLRFYTIARGSLEETRYYLILSKDLGLLTTDRLMTALQEVSKLLHGYVASMKRAG